MFQLILNCWQVQIGSFRTKGAFEVHYVVDLQPAADRIGDASSPVLTQVVVALVWDLLV